MKITKIEQLKDGLKIKKQEEDIVYILHKYNPELNGYEVLFDGKAPHQFDGILAFLKIPNILNENYFIVN